MYPKGKLENVNKNVGTTITRPFYKDMMNFKTQKGITLIALIITIVIMLILASVGTYVGLDVVEHSRVVKFVSYMQIIQKKVDQVVTNKSYDELGDLVLESGKQSEIK